MRAERQKAFTRGKDILTGTNAFPNIHETMPAVLDIAPPPPAAVTATALPRSRLAEPFEALRDASDKILAKTGARPKVFLATLGTPADFTPRASFAKNVFESGGVEAIEADGSDLAGSYKAAGAAIACLCSSDKVYEKEALAAIEAIKAAGGRHIYLAGRPGEREAALRAAGVESFIYDGCDVLSTLNAVYAKLGA